VLGFGYRAPSAVPLHSDMTFRTCRDRHGPFGAGFGGCEHPFDAGGSGVSLSFPRGDCSRGLAAKTPTICKMGFPAGASSAVSSRSQLSLPNLGARDSAPTMA
jgi:hypothetical protein